MDFKESHLGEVKAGQDWWASTKKNRWQRWTTVGWTAKNPSLYFVPLAEEEQLRLICAPFEYKGAPTQSLTALLNGHEIGKERLDRGYHEIRIPLPEEKKVPGINRIELRFAHSRSRTAAGLAKDRRQRAASCEVVEVQPLSPLLTPAPPLASKGNEGRPQTTQRPHVFIYLIDTLRADALALYGAARPTSPRIAEFARDSVLFQRGWSSSAWTMPSTMSLLTGLLPSRHGYLQPGSKPADPSSVQRLSEILKSDGYETLAVSQSYVVNETHDFDRGFETFYLADALSRGTAESADIPWFLGHYLTHRANYRPLFAFLHTVDPHQPYSPRGADAQFAHDNPGSLAEWKYQPDYFNKRELISEPEEIRHMRARYDGEVLGADRGFGAFVDLIRAAGLYDNSLIVLIADHGEEFGEHGAFGHGHSLYEEMVHIPFLIKFPEQREAGTVVEARVNLIDILPTILEIAAVDFDLSSLDGQSLATAGSLDAERVAISEVLTRSVRLRALAAGDLKCIYDELASTVQIFDLASDPAEKHPLPPDHASAKTCQALSQEHLNVDAFSSVAETELDDEARERLRALGYIN